MNNGIGWKRSYKIKLRVKAQINFKMGDVFLLEERQDSVLDNSEILATAAIAFVGQLLSVFLSMETNNQQFRV